MTDRVLLNCDECGKSTDVDEINWSADGSIAICPSCVATKVPLAPPLKPSSGHFPVFMLYQAGRLLHVTQDLGSAEQWQPFQRDDWWFYSVDSIMVKFFETPQQAAFIEKRLSHDLAPRYGMKPDPEEDMEGEPFTTYWVDTNSERKKLEKVLNIRITRDMWMALSLAAASDGARRTDWVRSSLYEALRGQSGAAEDSS